MKADIRRLRLPDQVTNWLHNYLSQRSVTICWGPGRRSVAIPMHRGLMQGGVLSPLLWNVHARYLLCDLRVDGVISRSYADDVQFSARRRELEEAVDCVETVGNKLGRRCAARNLETRPEKCQLCLHTQKRDVCKTILLGGSVIRNTPSVRFLGVQ